MRATRCRGIQQFLARPPILSVGGQIPVSVSVSSLCVSVRYSQHTKPKNREVHLLPATLATRYQP
jgi:hypothetical protein